MRLLALSLLLLAFCFPILGQVIPSSRQAQWPFAGVPGGIPIRAVFVNVLTTGNASYKCAGDGVTDDSTHIANAMSACPSNQAVYLPAATYYFGNRVYFAHISGVSIRGDGPGKTILKDGYNGGSLFSLGQVAGKGNGADNYLSDSNYFALSSGYTQGSSNLVLSVAGGNNQGVVLGVGNLVQLSEQNDTGVTGLGQNGQNYFSSITGDGQYVLNQMGIVTAVAGQNVTIWPPMAWTYKSGLAPTLYLQDFKSYGFDTCCRTMGFENLTITNALGTGAEKHVFDCYCCIQCWWTNVEVVNWKNYALFLDDSLQCQIDHCNFHITPSFSVPYQNYDIETEFSSYCLFQNNIFDGFFEALQIDSGGCGQVVAYNLFTNYLNSGATGDDTNRFAPGLSVSHGAYPMMTLVEGNVGGGIQGDEYWGSAGYHTIYRNLFTATDNHSNTLYTKDLMALKIDNANLNYSVVGNIIGNPSSSFSAYQMSGNGQPYSYTVIERFGYPGIDSNSYTGNDAGPQSLDDTVLSTMVLVQNYDYFNHAIMNSTNVSLGPTSFYLASKPAWFGNRPWPPFDPASPASASPLNIPAGYRYVYGVDPPGGVIMNAGNVTVGTVVLEQ